MKKYVFRMIQKVSDGVEMKLRKLCFGLGRDTRVIVAVCIVLISAFGSVFLLATAFYQLGKDKGKQEMMIKHFTAPELLIDRAVELKAKDNEKGS